MVIIYSVLVVHYIADFICQSSWQAENKSSDNMALLLHTTIYTIVWGFFIALSDIIGLTNYNIDTIIIFLLITFLTHTIIDYITSRVNTMLYKRKQIHWFFVSIGFDQLLHYIQLLVTINYLLN